jgi:hypothetical protein
VLPETIPEGSAPKLPQASAVMAEEPHNLAQINQVGIRGPPQENTVDLSLQLLTFLVTFFNNGAM